jgi:hypothetical protein
VIAASPLRASILSEPDPMTPPPPITPIDEDVEDQEGDSGSDDPSAPLLSRGTGNQSVSRSPSPATSSRSYDAGARNPFTNHRYRPSSITHFATSSLSVPGSELTVQLLPPPDSPMSPNANPPTPGQRDIHLQALTPGHRRVGSNSSSNNPTPTSPDRLAPGSPLARREPPAYSPLDAFTYADGVHIDLPAEVIAAALEGNSMPSTSIGQSSSGRTSGRRSRRR